MQNFRFHHSSIRHLTLEAKQIALNTYLDVINAFAISLSNKKDKIF